MQKILKAASLAAAKLDCSIYLVGGVVRDLLLRRSVFDFDIVVEGQAIAVVKVLAKIFKVDFSRHHAFGTATIIVGGHRIDFATARVEHYIYPGALPRVKPANLVDDLKRRDFTINAMAISLNKGDFGRLIDLYDGLSDLKKGLIRILHKESFSDDPTRILRAIRFKERFSFKFESKTGKLLKQAINTKALSLVNSHRLRDEIVLILKEPKPYRYIKRIKELEGFRFLHPKIRLKPADFLFFIRIEKELVTYRRKFRKLRINQDWLIYLAGIMLALPLKTIEKVMADFAFKKGERIIITSIKSKLKEIKKLEKCKKKSLIYKLLCPLSFEAIIFFYAYYPNKNLRKNIDFFLETLIFTKLKVKGKDLKKLSIKPSKIFGNIFEELLYKKIDKGIFSKKEELSHVERIYKRLSLKKN